MSHESQMVARMDLLEKKNHLLVQRLGQTRRIFTAVLSVFAILVLLGGTYRGDDPGTVKAERFVLLDADGKPRGQWVVDDGAAVQQFLDQNGRPLIELCVLKEGWAGLTLSDKEDNLRLALGLDPDGRAELSGYGRENDKPSLGLYVEKDGVPIQSFIDKNGRQRIGLNIKHDGEAEMAVYDKDGKLVFYAPRP